jgi:N-acetylglucosamine kinase-like BadF-type ATPase
MPFVVQVARASDPVAQRIMKDAGYELGRLATAVVQRLDMGNEVFAIIPFGGVFKAGKLILDPFREMCTAAAPGAKIILPKFEPEVGAVLIALDKLGVNINTNLLNTIDMSSSNFPLCRWKGNISDE